VLLVALLLLISCSRAEAAAAFEQALRLYELNQRKEAIPYFDRAVADDPNRKEAWLYRGRAYGETRNDGEALRSYERALRLDACYAEAFFQRGRVYLWNNNPEQAIRDFSSAIRCDAKVSKYYLQRASAHHQAFSPDMLGSQVHYKAAISDYAEAIRLDPQNWNAFAARCAFDYDFLDYRAGLADCNAAIRLNRNDAGLYANRAAILHALGRGDESRADAARAISMDPGMGDFINDTIRTHDRAEATRRQMLEEFRAGAGSGRDPCSSYSGSAQRACRAHDMPAAGRLGGGGGTRDDQQKYGR
jgi:tetratricopeptide (TPR) repeat protein